MPMIRMALCECGHNGARHPYKECHAEVDNDGPCSCKAFVDANPTFADAIHRRNRERSHPTVIDANTGEQIYPDTFFTNVNGEFFVCWLDVGLLSGTAFIRRNLNTVLTLQTIHAILPGDTGLREISTTRMIGHRPAKLGPVERVPLAVRWTHPSFFGKRVAFFPS